MSALMSDGTETTTAADVRPSPHEFGETTRAVLASIAHDYGGRATTPDVSSAVGKSSQTAGYHLRENLVPAGLVTKVGTEDVGTPIEANVYEVTDEEWEWADEWSEEAIAARMDREQMVREIRSLRDRNERLADRVDALEKRQDSFHENLNGLIDMVKDRVGSLERRQKDTTERIDKLYD